MLAKFQRLHRDERGMSFAFVGLGFMAFLSATTLAIDVGMFMTARSQAQNSADAGAHAGAVALVRNSFTDRTATGPVVMSALNAARANTVMSSVVAVAPADVEFPLDPAGQADRVKVTVYRTSAKGNAVPTLMGQLFGVSTVDIIATATGEASPANAMTCVKPFMIPDKWEEHSAPAGEFNEFTNKGAKLPNPDVYVPASDPKNYTGYTIKDDVGTPLVLRAGTGDQLNPSFYFSWKMPGDVGGDFYRDNISGCNPSWLTYDPDNPFLMTQEPGDKAGPTLQGIQDLIDQDSAAEWDPKCLCVIKSKFTGQSPRLFPIPLFDPQYYVEGKANGRPADFKLANFLGFFAVSVEKNGQINGIIADIVGQVDKTANNVPSSMFARAIRLVE
jgi:hypothetical protein